MNIKFRNYIGVVEFIRIVFILILLVTILFGFHIYILNNLLNKIIFLLLIMVISSGYLLIIIEYIRDEGKNDLFRISSTAEQYKFYKNFILVFPISFIGIYVVPYFKNYLLYLFNFNLSLVGFLNIWVFIFVREFIERYNQTQLSNRIKMLEFTPFVLILVLILFMLGYIHVYTPHDLLVTYTNSVHDFLSLTLVKLFLLISMFIMINQLFFNRDEDRYEFGEEIEKFIPGLVTIFLLFSIFAIAAFVETTSRDISINLSTGFPSGGDPFVALQIIRSYARSDINLVYFLVVNALLFQQFYIPKFGNDERVEHLNAISMISSRYLLDLFFFSSIIYLFYLSQKNNVAMYMAIFLSYFVVIAKLIDLIIEWRMCK